MAKTVFTVVDTDNDHSVKVFSSLSKACSDMGLVYSTLSKADLSSKPHEYKNYLVSKVELIVSGRAGGWPDKSPRGTKK